MSSYSRAHFRLVSPPTDTAEQIRVRLIRDQACARGVADREAKYPVLTEANVRDAIDYQCERIEFHLLGLQR